MAPYLRTLLVLPLAGLTYWGSALAEGDNKDKTTLKAGEPQTVHIEEGKPLTLKLPDNRVLEFSKGKSGGFQLEMKAMDNACPPHCIDIESLK